MGQAKARKAEIDALKAKSKESSLLDFMCALGDREGAGEVRSQIMHQIFVQMMQNANNILANAAAGSTTKAVGIQVGFDPKSMMNLDDYHISVRDRGAFCAIQEFLNNPTTPQPGMFGDRASHRLSLAFIIATSTHNIVVTDWHAGTLIDFIPTGQMPVTPPN